MTEMIGGLVPLNDFIAGLRADVLLQGDAGGETCIRLLDAIEQPASLEEDALAEYDRLAEASADPVIALTMRLILEDEDRHHTLLKRIAATPRDALNWSHTPAALPHADEVGLPDKNLVSLARALIDEERTGAAALRRLEEREEGVDGGLDSLLLEMMAMDSDKHAHLLRFVQRRLESRAGADN
jgi:hypothetical protein